MSDKYLSLFGKNKYLKKSEKYLVRLYQIRDQVEELVDNRQKIPPEIISDYEKTYKDFRKKFFSEDTIKYLKKENNDFFINDMTKTLENVTMFKNEIKKTNLLIKIIMVDTLNSYIEFLDLSEKICNDFIHNYRKKIK